MMVELHPTVKGDLDFVLTAEQHEDNRSFVNQWTREQHEAALEDKDISHLLIARTSDQTLVGYVILIGLADVNQSIGLKRLVVTHKGKGYGREVLRLVKKLAFEELYAHRLWLDVKDHNLRAQYIYESAGFIVEGVLRECLKTGDCFESLIVMSMLRTEYHYQQL